MNWLVGELPRQGVRESEECDVGVKQWIKEDGRRGDGEEGELHGGHRHKSGRRRDDAPITAELLTPICSKQRHADSLELGEHNHRILEVSGLARIYA